MNGLYALQISAAPHSSLLRRSRSMTEVCEQHYEP